MKMKSAEIPQKPINVLLIENGIEIFSTFKKLLANGYSIEKAETLSESQSILENETFDIIILDLKLSDSQGVSALKSLMRVSANCPVIVLIEEDEEKLGLDSIRNGAEDFLFKNKEKLNADILQRVIRYSIERNKILSDLRKSESSLKLAQEIAKMGTWIWYPEKDKFIPTEAFLSIFDIPGLKEQNSFFVFLRHVYPEDRKKISDAMRLNQQRLQPINLEFRIYTRDQSLKYILLRGNLVEGDGQSEPMYYGTGQDITQLKTTHENLSQRERFLEMTGEIVSLGGWEINLEEDEVFWTNAMYEIHGESSNLLITGDIAISYFSESDQMEIRQIMRDSRETSAPFLFEKKITLKSGEEKWVYCMGRTVFRDNRAVKVTGIMQDVTERRNQMEAFRIRAMMLDNVEEAAIAVDKEWRIIFWNKAAEKLFKYKKQEVIGLNTEELNLANLSKATLRSILSLLKQGQSNSGEYMMTDRNGREFPVWASNSPVFDTEGNVCALLNISRDISQEKSYLKQIEKSEERFRKLFEYSPLGKGLTDLTTMKWIDSNKTFLRLLGYSKKELTNLTVQDITPSYYQNIDKGEMKKLRKSGAFGPYQKAYIRKDGTLLKALITGFVIDDNEGNKKAWTHVLDITELEQTTEALSQSEERFKEYIENASDVFLTTDSSGMISYISPNIKTMLGYNIKEVIGKPIFYFVHQDETGELISKFKESEINIGDETRVTFKFRHKEGYYKYIQGQGSMRQRPNGEIYGLIIARDIDNERNAENHVLWQNRKLKDIAFIQSHIVRRPLANILGLLAINGMNEEMPVGALKLMDMIKNEAEIMDQIVGEIVDKSTAITNLPDYEK